MMEIFINMDSTWLQQSGTPLWRPGKFTTNKNTNHPSSPLRHLESYSFYTWAHLMFFSSRATLWDGSFRRGSMMTSSNGNFFRVTGHLCGEFTGPGEFPAQRPVMWSFDVLHLNKRLSKQWWDWWFETLSWSLQRQCNATARCQHQPRTLRYLSWLNR